MITNKLKNGWLLFHIMCIESQFTHVTEFELPFSDDLLVYESNEE